MCVMNHYAEGAVLIIFWLCIEGAGGVLITFWMCILNESVCTRSTTLKILHVSFILNE